MNTKLEVEFDEMDMRRIEMFKATDLKGSLGVSDSRAVGAIVRRYFFLTRMMDKPNSEAVEKLNRWAEEVPEVGLWLRICLFLHIDNIHFRCEQCHKWMLKNDYFCSDKCRNEWVPF